MDSSPSRSCGSVVEGFVTYGIKYLEVCFVNVRTQACCAPHHLLEQNSTLDAAHEYQSRNFRNINSGSQQIYSDCDAWISLILEALNRLLYLLLIPAADTAGNLHDRIVTYAGFTINYF